MFLRCSILHVVFVNPGTHPVLFHDPPLAPRSDTEDPRPRPVLRVTPDTDLPTPPFVRMSLTPPAPDSPKMIVLPGGGRFEVTAPWTPPAPGVYGAVAEWVDYGPPLEGVEHAPVMPLSADLNEPYVEMKAPYALMGGTFTGRRIEIPASGAPQR